ncbi:MAG: PEP-utilizing enzyme [Mobilitalea sp.]
MSTSFHWPAEAGTRYIQTFRTYCDELLGELSHKDYYDLIYEKSIITKERELLFKMADIIKSDPSLSELFHSCLYDEVLIQKLNKYDNGLKLLDKMKIYLHEFGICNSDYQDYIRPTLLERPEGIISKVRSLLEVDKQSFFSSIASIAENKKRILKNISEKLTVEGYQSFHKKLLAAQKAFLVTDTHNYYIERQSWGYLKLAVMEAAKTLIAENIITKPDDVYYLTFDELKNPLSWKAIDSSLIIERKNVFEKQKNLFPPRNIGKAFDNSLNEKSNVVYKDNSLSTSKELKGVTTFDGKIKGKIIKGIPQSINDDCILVVYHGHASDITHLLSRVKGLIFENGSPFDHLGIISREMNIPAIYYVSNALSMFKDGDLVEIDGARGVVNLIKEPDLQFVPTSPDTGKPI